MQSVSVAQLSPYGSASAQSFPFRLKPGKRCRRSVHQFAARIGTRTIRKPLHLTYQRFRFLASLGQNRVRSIKNLASTRTIEARFITYNQSYPYSVSGRISVSNCFDLIIMTRTSRIIMFIMADILPFCKVVKNSMCLSYCASQKKSIPFFVFLNKLFVRFIIFQTILLSCISYFVPVKKSRHKKYFFLFHFFKSGHTPHFGPFVFSKVDMTCIFCYFSFFKVDTPSAWACLRRFATNFGSSVRLLPSNVFFRSISPL